MGVACLGVGEHLCAKLGWEEHMGPATFENKNPKTQVKWLPYIFFFFFKRSLLHFSISSWTLTWVPEKYRLLPRYLWGRRLCLAFTCDDCWWLIKNYLASLCAHPEIKRQCSFLGGCSHVCFSWASPGFHAFSCLLFSPSWVAVISVMAFSFCTLIVKKSSLKGAELYTFPETELQFSKYLASLGNGKNADNLCYDSYEWGGTCVQLHCKYFSLVVGRFDLNYFDLRGRGKTPKSPIIVYIWPENGIFLQYFIWI